MNDTDTVDYFNNQYIESGLTYSLMLNETGSSSKNTDLVNHSKGAWYISLKPLPEEILRLP